MKAPCTNNCSSVGNNNERLRRRRGCHRCYFCYRYRSRLFMRNISQEVQFLKSATTTSNDTQVKRKRRGGNRGLETNNSQKGRFQVRLSLSSSARISNRPGFLHLLMCLLLLNAFFLDFAISVRIVKLVDESTNNDIDIDRDSSTNVGESGIGSTSSRSSSSINEVVAAAPEGRKVEEEEEKSAISSSSNDDIEDGIFDPYSPDPSCLLDEDSDGKVDAEGSCWSPPESTIETIQQEEEVDIKDISCSYGFTDPSDSEQQQQCSEVDGPEGSTTKKKLVYVDKHWGSDVTILKMRDKLRNVGYSSSTTTTANNKTTIDQQDQEDAATNQEQQQQKDGEDGEYVHPFDANKRPPIFLMPGLASTRLVSWKFKSCNNPLVNDIKVLDNVWLNIDHLVKMGTVSAECWNGCITLGINQTDGPSGPNGGCKLRPDEGLEAISSLAKESFGSQLLVGGTNTVYAWLVQWLADNLGYDVSSIIGLPYDWRLSPDIMEKRDGFLSLTKSRIEAAVRTNGEPGIMVAHSMGNIVFRYFLLWLRGEMRNDAYEIIIKRKQRRKEKEMLKQQQQQQQRNHQAEQLIDENISPKKVENANSNVESYLPVWGWFSEYFVSTDSSNVASSDDGTADETDTSSSTSSSGESSRSRDNAPPSFLNDCLRRNKDGDDDEQRHLLCQLAQMEGDSNYIEWLEKHIWTYVGLSAPLLGAVNPLRAVLSGENMGLPFSDDEARKMELSFGSTQTVNPISSKMGFCDGKVFDDSDNDGGERGIHGYNTKMDNSKDQHQDKSNLACLDDIMNEIQNHFHGDPWKDFPQLRNLLVDRVDWNTDFPMIRIEREECESREVATKKLSVPCNYTSTVNFGALHAQSGDLFKRFNDIFLEKDEPLMIKREQLRSSFWTTSIPNLLNQTWDRPHIKHVIMAYGVDVPTEVGYIYKKRDVSPTSTENDSKDAGEETTANSKEGEENEEKQYDGIPKLDTVIWEEEGGMLIEEKAYVRGQSLTSTLMKKKPKRRPLGGGSGKGSLLHSGDGTIPYISMSWAHTWLLHAARAVSMEKGWDQKKNPLDTISVTHRPKGAMNWLDGPGNVHEPRDFDTKKKYNADATSDTDTGTSHPHGTKYKPYMVKYQNIGKSRKTGMSYSTTVVEAIGVEHKETTRNYDILAAVFTDVLKYMSDDFGLI